MSFFELLLWAYIIAPLLCTFLVACECSWLRYCIWVLQRDRDLFWQQLEECLNLQTRRYDVPKGPYR